MIRKIHYHSAREFFSALQWDYSQESNIPVFSTEEISSLPLKWLKYLLLERVGLANLKDLESNILRFDIEEIEHARIACRELFESDEMGRRNSMVVLKII